MLPELNIEVSSQLIDYLRVHNHIEPAETPEIQLLPGGVSNRTVWVKRAGGETFVIKQALAKLRVPVDWFSSPQRVHREALGLRWLAQLAPAGTIPAFLFEDTDHHLLAMEAVPQPHANWKNLLLQGELLEEHVQQFGVLLATIHRAAYLQRAEVAAHFSDRTFFESLRLEPYYGYTASQVPAAGAFLTSLIATTRSRALTLVHGDYSPKNILVYANRLILLDHEVIHFGDPAFDLGFSLTHLLSKAHHLPAQRAAFASAAQAYWETYRRYLGDGIPWLADLEPHVVRHTLGCMLARVRGRSPLEYLSMAEKERQCSALLPLLPDPPHSLSAFINQFLRGLEATPR
jgi:5-methylthioribose kinase